MNKNGPEIIATAEKLMTVIRDDFRPFWGHFGAGDFEIIITYVFSCLSIQLIFVFQPSDAAY